MPSWRGAEAHFALLLSGDRRVELLDELDLRALEEDVQLLEVGLVQVQLADGSGTPASLKTFLL